MDFQQQRPKFKKFPPSLSVLKAKWLLQIHKIMSVSKDGIISTIYGIPGVSGYNTESDASKTLFNLKMFTTPMMVTCMYLIRKITSSIGRVYRLKLGDENALIEFVFKSDSALLHSVRFATDGLSFYFVDQTERFIMKAVPFCPEGFRISFKNHVCTNSTAAEEEESYGYILPLTGMIASSTTILVAVLLALWYHMKKNSSSQAREIREQLSYDFLSEDEEELQNAFPGQHVASHQQEEDQQQHNLIQMDP
ncbi:predicted protein [Naegleria gruberi]|uniref:Predicted protein n=1 Tax=Naegleria gruberi TaxID=5762 RepID=D2W4Y5_NAEGR|nr:uncharacterized protein NAEGRDRAFT_54703 [Naegleria gruberi]EFC35867.1 predicted protein [Naegleria gruberi]|eukprot:XP_002668611.1 predicted protein [Naegleria gruberi strain NEG-M]